MVDSSSHASDVEVQVVQTKLDRAGGRCSINHTKMCPPNSHAWVVNCRPTRRENP